MTYNCNEPVLPQIPMNKGKMEKDGMNKLPTTQRPTVQPKGQGFTHIMDSQLYELIIETKAFKEHMQDLEKRIEELEGKKTVNVHEFPSRYGMDP